DVFLSLDLWEIWRYWDALFTTGKSHIAAACGVLPNFLLDLGSGLIVLVAALITGGQARAAVLLAGWDFNDSSTTSARGLGTIQPDARAAADPVVLPHEQSPPHRRLSPLSPARRLTHLWRTLAGRVLDEFHVRAYH